MELKYKMICSDIDGTLLNAERDISERTAGVLRRIWDKYRVPTILVSSRMPKAMRPFLEKAGLQMPLIAYNGALILNAENEVLLKEEVPVSVLEKIAAGAAAEKLHISFYRADDWFTETDDFWALREINNTKVRPEFLSPAAVLSQWKTNDFGAGKVMVMGEPTGIDRLIKILEVECSSLLHLYRSKDTYLEISSLKVSKATAIEILRTQFDVEQSEIIAFGDNWNDTEMLTYAGQGVAMAHAPEGVKKCANEIGPGHKEDGVAQVLERYFPGIA